MITSQRKRRADHAWHNGFNRLQRCCERREEVIHAFFDFADAIITVRRLIREAWTLYPVGRPPGQASVTTHNPRSLSNQHPGRPGNDAV